MVPRMGSRSSNAPTLSIRRPQRYPIEVSDEHINTARNVAATASGAHEHSTGAVRWDPKAVASARADLHAQGYTIVESLLPPDRVVSLREELARMLTYKGRNAFEGYRTQRVYGLLARTFSLNDLVAHPLVLDLLDGMLLPNYLLSQVVAINILPGEDAQALHHDDVLYPIPRPRAPISVATMWALDDYRADNGGTRVVPGSHLWGSQMPAAADLERVQPIEMPAGSMLVFSGTLWHGGGANVSDAPRLGVTVQYCEPWCRTVENFGLSIAPSRAAQCPEELRTMLGYSIHGHLMGYVDGRHPKRLLRADRDVGE